MKLPSFVIIGAAKAATTWLSSVLRQQPVVFMPEPEVHFFNRNFERGLSWYAEWFAAASNGQLIGEKSASYLADPAVPARLARLLPDLRLIVQLRNPIERAYSDYCMLLRRGEVDTDVARYVDPHRTPTRRFVDDGLYARHLRHFLDFYPREQVKILLYDDIARSPDTVLRDVAQFIDLADPVMPAARAGRVKDKETPMLPLSARRLLRPLKGAARPLRKNDLFCRLHGWLARPISYPSLPDESRRRLAAYYEDDVHQLGHLINRDLGGWLHGKDRPA